LAQDGPPSAFSRVRRKNSDEEFLNRLGEASRARCVFHGRRSTTLPEDEPIRVVPDWVCEILSPTTRRHDLLVKKPYYARVGVSHHWLIDLPASTLTACRLESGRWVELGVFGDEREARIEPFEAAVLDVASWWV
jgi:Uma2 family endonuclease